MTVAEATSGAALALAWMALQATVVCVLGIGAYFLCSWRRGPASGATAVLGCLAALALVAALTPAPWPRWAGGAPLQRVGAVPAHFRAEVDVPNAKVSTSSRARSNDGGMAALAVPHAPSYEAPHRLRSWSEAREQIRLTARRLRALITEKRPPAVPFVAVRSGAGASIRPTLLADQESRVIREDRAEAIVLAQPTPSSRDSWPALAAAAVVPIYALGLLAGLGRVAGGLWSVRRLVLRSRRLSGAEVDAVCERIRSTYGIRRPIELRVSSSLSMPATVGWRRPVVLVPADWNKWTSDDRRAAIAHELAHVARSDYAAWLAAQLSVALHFYHPAVYWLRGRLRMAQELAADAMAARVSGGSRIYLTALARLALRAEERPDSGLERALFRGWSPFLRRIEMLRGTEGSVSRKTTMGTRLTTYGVLVCAGMLLAGLRPDTPRNSPVAQAAPIAAAGQEQTERPPGLLLEHIPHDAALVMAMRPSVLLERRELQSWLDAVVMQSPEISRMVGLVDLASIEQVTVVLGRSVGAALLAGDSELAAIQQGGLVVRTKSPRDWKAAFGTLVPLSEARRGGRVYHQGMIDEGLALGLFQPDERTVVIATAPALYGFLRADDGNANAHPWSESWRKVSGGELAMVADVAALAGPYLSELNVAIDSGKGGEMALLLGTIAPLWEESETLAIGLTLADHVGARVTVACGDDAGATRVERTLEALLTLCENASTRWFPLVRRAALGGVEKAEAQYLLALVDFGEQILDNAEVTRDGTSVGLSLRSRTDLATLVRLVLQIL
jgi:hypothetical protein